MDQDLLNTSASHIEKNGEALDDLDIDEIDMDVVGEAEIQVEGITLRCSNL